MLALYGPHCTDTVTVASLLLFSMFCAYSLTSQAAATPLATELPVLFVPSLSPLNLMQMMI
jgi:hypothetical protein